MGLKALHHAREAFAEGAWQVVLCNGPGPAGDVEGGEGAAIGHPFSGLVEVNQDGQALACDDDVAGVKVHVVDAQVEQGLHLRSEPVKDPTQFRGGKGGGGQGVVVGEVLHEKPAGAEDSSRFDGSQRDWRLDIGPGEPAQEAEFPGGPTFSPFEVEPPVHLSHESPPQIGLDGHILSGNSGDKRKGAPPAEGFVAFGYGCGEGGHKATALLAREGQGGGEGVGAESHGWVP